MAGCAAALAGLALLFAFPPYDQWWLAPVGVALFAVAVHRRRARVGAGLGALTGLVFFVPLLSWAALEIDAAPWLLLSASQAAFVAALGAAAAYLSPLIDRAPLTWPVWVAVLWVGQEALRSRVPFGGFPWGRLAFSQADSPLLPLAAIGGAPLVSGATALVGGVIAAVLWRLTVAASSHRGQWVAAARAQALPVGALLAAVGAVLLASMAVPQRQPDGPPVTVAIVQGNVPRLGLDFNAQRRAVLDNHVRATEELAQRVGRGEAAQPDLVVWPENSSDIDPIANPDAGALISGAADAIDAPILVGAIVRDPAAAGPYNVGLVWQPGTGPGEMYAKRQPVPFAEYLPLQPVVEPIARWLTGDDVDRVGGFAAGDEPGVLQLGPAAVGDVICFEVAYDGLVRDSVVEGAELLAVQTNNATFNEAEAYQQLAMVRLRAVEHGRESLMASTVGISGFVGVDGQVSDATGFFTQDVPVRTLSLATGRTLATTVGVWPEALLATGALAGLAAAFVLRRRSRTKVIDVNERST
ncbi:apolipoprotein N-acyltransferase [Natronosporangium hydrolyticum]|uniref:apolipoprotein N-acyltransferase n=1 Tax=Natronosporangium hydrolyticum TaxID=2811111 RepID=UPI001EFA189E|nr:apolipoprotein N-acyltransferase [Natronosporangium hydrolyticum]